MAWRELDEPSAADGKQHRGTIRMARVGDGLSCSWGEMVRNSTAIPHRQSRLRGSSKPLAW